jgi:hypothetical protein
MDVPLKNSAELASRLELGAVDRLLLIDAPAPLQELVLSERADKGETRFVEGKAIRTVKEGYDGILLWREDRVGSQSLFEAIAKRAEPGGSVWAVVPLRKMVGLATPAARRLNVEDLARAFPLPHGLETVKCASPPGTSPTASSARRRVRASGFPTRRAGRTSLRRGRNARWRRSADNA